jgi:hypothetical protein
MVEGHGETVRLPAPVGRRRQSRLFVRAAALSGLLFFINGQAAAKLEQSFQGLGVWQQSGLSDASI